MRSLVGDKLFGWLKKISPKRGTRLLPHYTLMQLAQQMIFCMSAEQDILGFYEHFIKN